MKRFTLRGPIAAAPRCVAFVAAVVLCLLSAPVSAQILAVLSDDSAGYKAVVDELRAGLQPLRDGSVPVESRRIDSVVAARVADIDAARWSSYELVVTVGLAAAQTTTPRLNALPGAPPMLCLLIPRQGFLKLPLPESAARRASAVFIDQPLSRQLDLLRLALPERLRVGVILGPSSKELGDEVRGEASKRGLAIASAPVSERADIYPVLQTLIPESDLLLLLPDPVAINADTVYGLLLTTYRAGVPVIGFSEGLLNAGALVSLFSTAQQQGRQGADIARRVLAHEGALPAAQYPRYFSVRVNASVARSLGLHVPPQEELQTALSARAIEAVPGEADQAAPRRQP